LKVIKGYSKRMMRLLLTAFVPEAATGFIQSIDTVDDSITNLAVLQALAICASITEAVEWLQGRI
jgi:hypothetical protein